MWAVALRLTARETGSRSTSSKLVEGGKATARRNAASGEWMYVPVPSMPNERDGAAGWSSVAEDGEAAATTSSGQRWRYQCEPKA